MKVFCAIQIMIFFLNFLLHPQRNPSIIIKKGKFKGSTAIKEMFFLKTIKQL